MAKDFKHSLLQNMDNKFGRHCFSCGIHNEHQEEVVPQITNGAMLELYKFFKHQEHNLPKLFLLVSNLLGDFNFSYADFYNKMHHTFLSSSSALSKVKNNLVSFYSQIFIQQDPQHCSLCKQHEKQIKQIHQTALSNFLQMTQMNGGLNEDNSISKDKNKALLERLLEQSAVGQDVDRDLQDAVKDAEYAKRMEAMAIKHKQQMINLLEKSQRELESVVDLNKKLEAQLEDQCKEIKILEAEACKYGEKGEWGEALKKRKQEMTTLSHCCEKLGAEKKIGLDLLREKTAECDILIREKEVAQKRLTEVEELLWQDNDLNPKRMKAEGNVFVEEYELNFLIP